MTTTHPWRSYTRLIEGPNPNTDLTPSVLWLSNLSDGSGLVSAGVRYDGIDFVTLGLDYRYLYGPDGAEYRVAGASHTLSLSVTVSGSF